MIGSTYWSTIRPRPGSRRMKLALPVLLVAVSAAGCLKLDMRAAIRPGGRTDAQIAFNGPPWVLNSVAGGDVEIPTQLSQWRDFVERSPLLKAFRDKPLLYAAKAGEGAWLLGTQTPDDMQLPFVKFHYEELADRWTFVGEIMIEASKAKELQTEVSKRLGLLPRMNEKQRNRMAGLMLRQAEVSFAFEFPGEVSSTNATEAESLSVQNWKFPLSRWLEADAPPKVMFASGKIDGDFRFRRSLLAALPSPELD